MKSTILGSLALSLAMLGLSACGGGSDTAEQADAAPDGIPGVTVSNARLVLPAVKGNPGVLYFDIAYGEDGTPSRVALSGVHIAGAQSAMMHEYSEYGGETIMTELMNQVVAKGESISFAPGGMHVMANNLDDSLVAGGTTEVTLTFAGGDKLSFPAEIRAAGDDR
ncbi:MAG TPA: copper chaperone PCu(A)C [Sphingomonadaceae bacterium]|nr:copper chaperone PCu(A)C [Sphingomonadaceae bacterium]